jgi:SAM-dependent methyltransferase
MPASPPDTTARFSGRVADYVRARPGYPPELAARLATACGWRDAVTIADVGSGTGLLAQVFLDAGHRVIGVEPNGEMRAAGDALLGTHGRFSSVGGRAEATGLAAASVDLVSAGQAFHWFDRQHARAEFIRILRPGGHVALVWNDRRLDATPFLQGYEALLVAHCPEYLRVVHRNVDEAVLAEFFAPAVPVSFVLDNRQEFDWEGLVARHLSSSFVPREDRTGHMAALRALWDRHQRDGRVTFEYDVRVTVGRLGA